jgi:hypothetical protein
LGEAGSRRIEPIPARDVRESTLRYFMPQTPRIRPPKSKSERKIAATPQPLAGAVLLVWGGETLSLEDGGEVVIGRATDCDIVLDDALVSRHHARITVRTEGVFVEDLLSANGVYVNGMRVQRMQGLYDGDRILVATREISAFEQRPDSVPPSEARISHGPPVPGKSSAVTGQANPFAVIGSIAEQMLSAGRITDAEHVLDEHMSTVLDGARSALVVPENVSESAALYALRFAKLRRHGRWVDYAVELYMRARRAMPGPIVDELCDALKVVPEVDLELFQRYLEVLRTLSPGMHRPDLESLNRLACLNLPGGSEPR